MPQIAREEAPFMQVNSTLIAILIIVFLYYAIISPVG